jgi:hypothetical protein
MFICKYSLSVYYCEYTDHPWIREDGEAPDKPLDITVISRMKQFRAMNKLKKVALKVIGCLDFVAFILVKDLILRANSSNIFRYNQVVAENLSDEEIMGLKEMFRSLDADNSGTITLEELRSGLPKLGTKISESEITQLMEAVCSSSRRDPYASIFIVDCIIYFQYIFLCSALHSQITIPVPRPHVQFGKLKATV